MKNKWIILGLFTIGGMGCDSFIDLKPENAVTYTNAMETPEEMEAVLSTAQANFQGTFMSLKMQEMAGEVCNGCEAGMGIGPSTYSDAKAHMWDNTVAPTGYWGAQYATIGYANIVSYNVKSHWADKDKNYFLGQAAFLKGICYYDLARRWGEAPILPDNDYEAPQVAKSSNHDLLEKATKEALASFDYLPRYADLKFADGTPMDNRQYANKEIAATLLAYIYAWRATMEEGVTPDKSKEYWEASEKYASMLLDGELTGYVNFASTIQSLQANTLNSRHGEEAILELEFNTKYTLTMPSTSFYVACDTWGYPYKYGTPEGEQVKVSISCKLVNELYGENTPDERKSAYFDVTHYDPSATFTWPDEPARIEIIKTGPGGIWEIPMLIGGLPREAVNRAYVKKFNKEFIYSSDPNQPKSFVNFDCNKIIWRYSDLLLLRAEVRNFLGNTSGAIKDLNRIRERAKVDLYPAATDTRGLQYAIFHEREKELIYENHRFFDVLRNKDYYKTELPANFRMLTEQEIKDGALYLPIDDGASEYNKLMMPNKYWYSKRY